MSKLVKELVTKDLRRQLSGVNDALLVNVVGSGRHPHDAKLRRELRARTSTWKSSRTAWPGGRPKARRWLPAFEGVEGTLGDRLGGRRHRLAGQGNYPHLPELKEFEGFEARGGAMDGAKLSPAEVKASQQLAEPAGAIEPVGGPDSRSGSDVSPAIDRRGRRLASQIKQRVEDLEKNARRSRSGAAPVPRPEPPAECSAGQCSAQKRRWLIAKGRERRTESIS